MIDLLDKYDWVIEQRNTLTSGGRDSVGVVMEKVISPTEAIISGKHTILVGTYNYMGMTFEPDVIAAGKKALDTFGTGTTGSRVLNGTYEGHKQLEANLADFYGVKHCIVYSTGYQANLGM
jgi:8-amino-7-oxononanoate synthase